VTQPALNQISVLENNIVRIEAGAACVSAARLRALRINWNLFLAGVPGTIGGAIGDECPAHRRRNLAVCYPMRDYKIARAMFVYVL